MYCEQGRSADVERVLARLEAQTGDETVRAVGMAALRARLRIQQRDYAAARQRARDVARATLGEELWTALQGQGYPDLPSRLFPGVTYRLRVGRRIEVLFRDGSHCGQRDPGGAGAPRGKQHPDNRMDGTLNAERTPADPDQTGQRGDFVEVLTGAIDRCGWLRGFSRFLLDRFRARAV